MALHPIPYTALLRERLRSSLRQILFFLLIGGAIGVLAFSSFFERAGMQGETSEAIGFLVFFALVFGLPLWALYRFVRFVARG
jgi:hypothetical protein